MNLFEFELTFSLPDPGGDPEEWLDALYDAGCDDALIGTGKYGYIALDFSRKARTARIAMQSAIRNVQKAIPGSALVEAKPDLVSLTEISQFFGFTRQAAYNLANDAKRGFPEPAHTGQTALWHLVDVLAWAESKRQPLVVSDPRLLFEISASAVETNAAVQSRLVRRVKEKLQKRAADWGFIVVKKGKSRKETALETSGSIPGTSSEIA